MAEGAGEMPESSTRVVHSQSSILDSRSSILLVGCRCTGKTTTARLLATRLGWAWVDSDSLLEERCGRTISAIFTEEGEKSFRDQETKILEELCRGERLVIATGGGSVLHEENRRRMRSAGKIVWLTADAETIWKRMQGDPTTAERRPPLTVGGLAEVRELLAQREPLYRGCADVIVESDRAPEEVVDAILDALGSLSQDS